jgi:GNAT-family acetyltransferase (TIGR03103 family)
VSGPGPSGPAAKPQRAEQPDPSGPAAKPQRAEQPRPSGPAAKPQRAEQPGPSGPAAKPQRAEQPRSATTTPIGYEALNRYARIIADEALERRISVEITDASIGELQMRLGDRTLTTIESLSELTSAIAFRRCDHKPTTREVLERAKVEVPPGRLATFDDDDLSFLAEQGELVVKPARGEQGWGISIGVTDADGLHAAIERARRVHPEVLLEKRCPGDDLRVVVIDEEVVAASVRKPPSVVGDGGATVAALVESLSRVREEATGGSSTIPLDETTIAVVEANGWGVHDVLPNGEVLVVRETANLHTGGTIHDVTDELSSELRAVAVRVAQAIAIPVVGVDLMVPSVTGTDYVVIEANEQPGLANHEPRPTAERFIDLLFPETASR